MQANEELAQLVQQRTWDKELLLWSGPEAKLLPALTGVQVETLDLLDLFDSGQPTWSGLSETGSASRRDAATWHDDEAIRRHLSPRLDLHLRETNPREPPPNAAS